MKSFVCDTDNVTRWQNKEIAWIFFQFIHIYGKNNMKANKFSSTFQSLLLMNPMNWHENWAKKLKTLRMIETNLKLSCNVFFVCKVKHNAPNVIDISFWLLCKTNRKMFKFFVQHKQTVYMNVELNNECETVSVNFII